MTCWLKKAEKMLHDGKYTFVLINRDKQYTSTLMGIAPAIGLLKNSPGLMSGAAVADKVVGKSAALLFIYGGVKQVYARVISSFALSTLEYAGVDVEYENKVPFIKNRAGDGMCPMEKTVLDISDAGEGYEKLKLSFD